ncbi:hypothetical protein AX14_007077 [Amanita brunnescens Koide BX004]|nr:hypothetical protein AX14_007077 [Amanita brunnescens Koide BX004]
MAPLAGRPPYATDEPDAIYETPQPAHRIRQQQPEDPNKRTSAYNVYDNYLGGGDSPKATNRQSGIDAVGAGLLAMDDDDEDESDPAVSDPPASKNAALAAATAPAKRQNQHQMNIAAPRPGYAAPIAALNGIPSPEPVAVPQDRRPSADAQMSMSNPFIRRSMENPFDPPGPSAIRAHYCASPSPSHPPSPHPLQPPITPIMPVFARPAKPTGVTIDEKPQVTRTERAVLPSRGEKGDDFWKRFSMVAKEPSARKESNWLRQTRSGYSRLSRWIWCFGTMILIAAVLALALWFYIAHNSTSSSTPTSVGGSANEAATLTTSSASIVPAGSSTIRHVSPTNTVARRDIWDAFPTPISNNSIPRRSLHKNRMADRLF